MINWSEIVGSATAGNFVTLEGTQYGFRNDIEVSESRGINIIGNPTNFFSNNPGSITDGRSRNALRMFIYNALRADSDYTDSQAAAWGSQTADEVLFIVQNVGGQAGIATWPKPASVGGSQTASAGNSNRRLAFIAIRDRNGHARAWRIKPGALSVAARGAFATSYDKLSDTQIRTQFTAPAAAGTFNAATVDVTLDDNTAGDVTFPAATGGTGTITYSLSLSPRAPYDSDDRIVTDSITVGPSNSIRLAASLPREFYHIYVIATWTQGATTATAQALIDVRLTRRARVVPPPPITPEQPTTDMSVGVGIAVANAVHRRRRRRRRWWNDDE